jgi:hypothetical protein
MRQLVDVVNKNCFNLVFPLAAEPSRVTWAALIELVG